MARRIPEELAEFFEGGLSIQVGTRNAELRSEVVHGAGAMVSAERDTMTIYVLADVAQRIVEDVRDGGPIAVTFGRPIDHRTIQVKGKVLEVRPSNEADRRVQERWLAAYVEQLYIIGLPRSVTRRLRVWPSLAITFSIEATFDQTPGPLAGRPLAADPAPRAS